MSDFKPMVKMTTTEPSVILKLKKGGAVAPKHGAKAAYGKGMNFGKQGANGPKANGNAPDTNELKIPAKKDGGSMGDSPAKPSIAARQKAMVPTKMFAKTPHTVDKKVGSSSNCVAGFQSGGTINGNEAEFVKTKHVSSKNHHNVAQSIGKKGTTNGGYKDGGEVKKKSDGGEVSTGRAVKMPEKAKTQPVRTTAFTGAMKDGGMVHKAEGGDVSWTKLNPTAKEKYMRVNAPVKASRSVPKADEDDDKPSLRLVKTHTGPKGHVAKVYKDREWGEHRVKFFDKDGKYRSAADYHAGDLEDANGTAAHEVEKGYKTGGDVKSK
jgi:hypothetical protein